MIRINLLSVKEAAQEEGRRQETRLIGVAVVALFAFLITVEVGSRMKVTPLVTEQHRLEAEIKVVDAKAEELKDLDAKRAELDEKLQTIVVLEKKKVGPVQILADLSDAAPDRVWLLDFTEINGGATITGMALDNQTIASFMRELAGSPYFESVDLVETTQADEDGLLLKRFVVNARLSYAGTPLPPAQDLKYPDAPRLQQPQRRRNKGRGRA